MRRFCLVLMAALLSFACPAAAQTTAPAAPPAASSKDAALKMQLANRFITLIQGEQMGEMMGQMVNSFMDDELEGLSGQEVADYRAAMNEVMRRMMPQLFDAIAPVYADIFTVEELRGLVAFYESDLGRSLIAKSYEAGPRMSEAIQAAMPAILSDMAVVVCDQLKCSAEELREMKAQMRAAPGD
ncbi:MAG: DUF2059 domain-containing protein [Brevundimonas sp.]|uniref:DUF2059 domain-containing protein n=1 Tax=Brevundimonas sp. TaxID=1871086 RepID=UPI004033754F